MAGTYRKTLVNDGYYNRGNTARKGAAEMKKLDRRMKRREAENIKRAAMLEYEADIADAIDHSWGFLEDDDFVNHDDYWEGYDDPVPEPDYGWDDYEYDHYEHDPMGDSMDDYEHYYGSPNDAYEGGYYSAGSINKRGLGRFDMNERVSTEDAGKTLGEILEEVLKGGE